MSMNSTVLSKEQYHWNMKSSVLWTDDQKNIIIFIIDGLTVHGNTHIPHKFLMICKQFYIRLLVVLLKSNKIEVWRQCHSCTWDHHVHKHVQRNRENGMVLKCCITNLLLASVLLAFILFLWLISLYILCFLTSITKIQGRQNHCPYWPGCPTACTETWKFSRINYVNIIRTS
jgi:hypothetical protein